MTVNQNNSMVTFEWFHEWTIQYYLSIKNVFKNLYKLINVLIKYSIHHKNTFTQWNNKPRFMKKLQKFGKMDKVIKLT